MKVSYGWLVLAAVVASTMAFDVPTRTPRIIQGGMGIRISKWQLAREVSKKGELGVISGTSMDTVLVRDLQNGDPDGSIRRALASFPDQDMVKRVMDKFFIENGKGSSEPYKTVPMWTLTPSQLLLEVTVLANYCEVWLAKHNDDGSPIDGFVGINLLTKVQLPTVPSLYGAMLANVDYVIMGAGIPLSIPGLLDNLSDCEDCQHRIDVAGVANDDQFSLDFSPKMFWSNAGKPELAVPLKRPNFLPIVSSVVLAQSMLKRATGKGPTKGIQGFVVELNTAGGHNAPPRGFRYDPVAKSHDVQLNERGEPVYGPKDDVDIEQFSKACKGLPFWFAGSFARPEKIPEIIRHGGAGIQVGTMFALAEESGMEANVKRGILRQILEGDLDVFTDPVASPTGFPFKVLELDNTLSDDKVYEERPRVCSLGYLRSPYMRDDGKIGYRCPSEPVKDWLKKGGEVEATLGRKCLCNALCANIGSPQVQKIQDENGKKVAYTEPTLITIGNDINWSRRFVKEDSTGKIGYKAADIVEYLQSFSMMANSRNETDIGLLDRSAVLH
jgi:nitronate monooxygenase